MKNLQVAEILNNIADILELQEVQFKPQAYKKAALAIEAMAEDIEEFYKQGKLQDIPGVGEHIALKIEEIIKTGKLKYYEKLKKQVKIDIEGLKRIPTLGPKKIKLLYKNLGIRNIKDLEKAIKQKKIENLKGFGKDTVRNFKRGIQFVKSRPKRFFYAYTIPIVEDIKKALGRLPEVKKIEAAGSFRRGKETIGDLDFVVVSNKPRHVMKLFTSLPDIKKILAQGTTKSSLILGNNLQVDLRVVKEREFGSAMNYFTGCKQHNIELRKLALKKGYSLSEYGLFKLKSRAQGNVRLQEKRWAAGRTEEEIYKKLGMQYVPPELRENRGEIAAALSSKLPKLVMNKEINGTFHTHTNWSDGDNTILEMAQKADELRLKFISFNDHSGPVRVNNPVTERRLES